MAKVTIRKVFDNMPQGAAVGQEVEVDDARIAQLERDGFIERKPQAANQSKTQVEPTRLNQPTPNNTTDKPRAADSNEGKPSHLQNRGANEMLARRNSRESKPR